MSAERCTRSRHRPVYDECASQSFQNATVPVNRASAASSQAVGSSAASTSSTNTSVRPSAVRNSAPAAWSVISSSTDDVRSSVTPLPVNRMPAPAVSTFGVSRA